MSAAALYLRVSTEEQDLAGQERDLRQYAEGRGWSVVAVYQEKASAAGKVERDEYRRLWADAMRPERPFRHLLVWSLDRWSREDRLSRAFAALEALEEAGLQFHSFREPFLDTSPDGSRSMERDMLRAVLPIIAAFESRRRSERTKLALREIGEGRRPTRSGRPVGRPVRVTPEKVRTIERLRSERLPWKQIAGKVGLPAETCRRASWLLKRRERTVGNSPPVIIGASSPGEVAR